MMFADRFSGSFCAALIGATCVFGMVGCQDYVASQPAVAIAEAAEPAGDDIRKPVQDAAADDPKPQIKPASDAEDPSAAGEDAAASIKEPRGKRPKEDKLAGEPAGDGANDAGNADPLEPANPFRRRYDIPEFPKRLEWINSQPLSKRKLKGKFVLLDFWTYCCINCMHVLPELKKLEKQYPNELVVIGVHSAKFDTEKDTENILAAVLRHEIEHPVINDGEHEVWDTYGISSWPTILMIDPEGKAVWGRSGEFKAQEVAEILNLAIPYYKKQNLLDQRPFTLELAAEKLAKTPLRFPGKVLADEAGKRLFIADSNHNRIVVAALDGKLIDVIGSGVIGRMDGEYKTASFDHPQGMALHNETLYVADTENHLLRKVDLKAKRVATIAGTGVQARHPWPGLNEFGLESEIPSRFVGKPSTTAINSPWDLWIHDGDLYIAMAGPHQIWKMPLDESEIGPYAGNGREDIVDGPLLPRMPYATGYSSFAQPSGLASDGTWLYVADSEGSSIRAVPFDSTSEVKTVVGTADLPLGRLFSFGDEDGPRKKAKLQHCLGVVFADGKLYVADTYNNKVKEVDPETGHTRTLAGTGKPGRDDEVGSFDEPAGIAHAMGKLYIADTNNHLIRTIELASGTVGTLAIAGLMPPSPAKVEKKPSFKGAAQAKVAAATLKAIDGQVSLKVSLKVPDGWKINSLAPMSYWLDSAKEKGPADRSKFGKRKLDKPVAEFDVPVQVTGVGDDEINVSLNYYYCQGGDDGLCKMGSVVFTVPLKIAADGATSVTLSHKIAD